MPQLVICQSRLMSLFLECP
uniref:Uncharacterized protein n=1 Tax=Arundo donax TaxID=35708 RepID=A0A0A9AV35_ARUDO